MLDPAATAFINHLLRGASWARDSLKPFAGRTARFEVAPFVLSLTVLENGETAPAAAGAVPAATAKLTPGLMLRLAAHDGSALREVEISGDADFVATIHYLARNLRWDVEEDLARAFGDVTARRMTETARTFRTWGERAVDNTARSFAEYWTEEQPLIAPRRDLEEFHRAVDRLRDDVAHLEKRVGQLVGRKN
jgi:ubiquinone biosynthesis protein UbiJ